MNGSLSAAGRLGLLGNASSAPMADAEEERRRRARIAGLAAARNATSNSLSPAGALGLNASGYDNALGLS